MKPDHPLRLRNLSLGAKLGLTCAVLTLFGGYVVASLAHMYKHHESRDGEPGLSVTDIKGVYHGVTVEAPLRRVLEADHPNELIDDENTKLLDEDREILLRWLSLDSSEITQNYDNIDFAALSPKEVIEMNCLSCHGRAAAREKGGDVSLAFWDEIQPLAFPNEVNPVDAEILLMSTHAHASTMALVAIVVSLTLLLTSWPRWVIGTLILFGGLGVLIDLGAWWVARPYGWATWSVILGGAVHSGAMTLAMLGLVIDLWRPRITSGA